MVTNQTFAFAMIVTLFAVAARFTVFARARRTIALFMYDMPSDRMTRSMSLAHLVLNEQSQYRERRRLVNTYFEGE